MKLTAEFNALIQPYMAERPDGRKLRLIILPDGHSFFAWAHPHGEEGWTSKDLEEKFGPVTWLDELSPEEAYSTLKLTPAGA